MNNLKEMIEKTKELIENGASIKEACKFVLTNTNNVSRKRSDYFMFIDTFYPELKQSLDQKYFKNFKLGNKFFFEYITDTCNHCKACNKPIPSDNECCSKECMYKYGKRNETYRQTCLRKYGCESPLQNKEIMAKLEQTNIERYGVKRPSQNKEIRQKITNTMVERYGVENYTQASEYKDKLRATSIKRYGTDYPCQNKEVREKIENTNIKRYGVKSILCDSNKRKEFEDIAKSKRPNDPYNTEKARKTMLERHGVTNWVNKNMKNIDNYNKDYIVANFIDDKGLFMINECCEYFNVGRCGLNKFKVRNNINNINNDHLIGTSHKEIELFDSINTADKYQHDFNNIIPNREVDMVIPSIKLCIEYNGNYWHREEVLEKSNRDGKNYHLNKTLQCREKGYQLFHVFEYDDIEIWKSMINNKLGLCEKIYARKCDIREVDYNTSMAFLEQNHLQGGCPSKYRYGLYYNNELVELITFGKSRFNKKYDYELLRLCTKLNTTVVGGASKLFKHFIKHHNGSVISYANRRFSNGNVYEQLGFKYVGETQPNYCYVKTEIMLTRIQCQKHKLKNVLGDNFDPNLTEKQNMLNNGYGIIYDCGNLIYEYI